MDRSSPAWRALQKAAAAAFRARAVRREVEARLFASRPASLSEDQYREAEESFSAMRLAERGVADAVEKFIKAGGEEAVARVVVEQVTSREARRRAAPRRKPRSAR